MILYDMGVRLKELRKRKGLTQKQVGELLGVHVGTVAAYEGNTRTPANDMLCRLAKLYNTTTDYILGLSDNDAFCVYGLTSRQRDLLNNLVLEFKSE